MRKHSPISRLIRVIGFIANEANNEALRWQQIAEILDTADKRPFHIPKPVLAREPFKL